MVKHTQTICRQQPTHCLSVFNHLVEFSLKELMKQKIELPDIKFNIVRAVLLNFLEGGKLTFF